MKWETRKPLITPRSHPAVTVWENRIYAIGGGGPDFKSLSSIEIYDSHADKWEELHNMPTSRSGCMASADDGKIYVIGGGYKKPDGKFVFLPSVEIYDIKKDAWEKGTDMLYPHDYPACVLNDNSIYIMAGHHPTATEGGPKTDPGFDVCEKYIIGGTKWNEISRVNLPRFGPSAQVINGEIWLMGGVALSSAGFNNYDIIERYNLQTNIWRQDEKIKLGWPAAAFGTAYKNNILYIMGGYSGNSIHDRFSMLDCGKEKINAADWKDLPPMTKRKAAMGTVICNSEIFTVGGWAEDGRTPINDNSSYKI